MDQEVKYIDIDKLVLWTENPRDPIDENATDQEVVNRAFEDKDSKWSLSKLAKEMGDYYDLSELPTVVFHGKKPVVYDGNRRIVLGKIKNGLVKVEGADDFKIPSFPTKLPCNVCTKPIALKNVYRKHADSGSWTPLDRDIFLHKFMKEEKSILLKLEDSTNLISNNPHLNQGFVKQEIFTAHNLAEMGFEFEGDNLVSKHTAKEAKAILKDVSNQIALKNITTRKNRGQVLTLLENSNREVIDKNRQNPVGKTQIHFDPAKADKKQRQSPRVKTKEQVIFGGILYLKSGDVSNLYRDIADLFSFYKSNKNTLSDSFPSLIRMSLRLLCEAAAPKGINDYINSYFEKAKKELDSDTKTSLSNQNVNKGTLAQLLHTGAHNYSAANNLEQTIAVSIILGAMLTQSHGKK